MIGRIAGRLEYRSGDHVLIDVRGVGYLVYVSDRTLASLPGVGEGVALFTDLLVREDLLQLFGFPTMLEKEWHRLLMTVQGVGAKASMAILSALGTDGVGRAIAMGDARVIQSAQGVGPKLAQRVILELKAKAPNLMALGTGPVAVAHADDVIEAPMAPRPRAEAATPRGNSTADALSALTNLGYAPMDAAGAVARAAAEAPEAETGALIRAALKLLAPKA
jgi:holliday junction DNA helicase RuvA